MNNFDGDGLLIIIVIGVAAYAVLDYFALRKDTQRGNDTISRMLGFLDIALFFLILAAVYINIARPYLDGKYYFHIAHPMLILGLPIFGFRAGKRFKSSTSPSRKPWANFAEAQSRASPPKGALYLRMGSLQLNGCRTLGIGRRLVGPDSFIDYHSLPSISSSPYSSGELLMSIPMSLKRSSL